MNELPRYKVYKRRMQQIESGKMRKKKTVKWEESEKANECIIEGRHIVELKVIAEHLYCCFCKEILSLEDTENERRKGLASILTVKCRKCLVTTSVPTSKAHKGAAGAHKQFDTNSKAVLGAIHSGLGYTTVNKFLNVMNVPSVPNKTFKNYEREMGPVVDSVAKDSCAEACVEERQLTLSQAAELQKRLLVDRN